jgi:hypothetical protein
MMDKKQLLADAYALASNIDALAGVLLTACTELVNQDSVSSPFDAGLSMRVLSEMAKDAGELLVDASAL